MFTDLQSLRRISPVLLAAGCAVSALHEQSDAKVFEACNTEFLKLVSRSMWEKRGVKFLRALCLGSYWLWHASRILSRDALRPSSDVRLPSTSSRSLFQIQCTPIHKVVYLWWKWRIEYACAIFSTFRTNIYRYYTIEIRL